MNEIIKVENLSHSYGDLLAVDNITFSVKKGQIFSFLGPNGAGKTTTINILITLLPLQKGEVTLSGFDLKKQKDKVRDSIGIVFQDEVLDRDLTVWETLEFHGKIYSIPKEIRRSRIEELIQLVELTSKRDEYTKNLSGGMKRRLEIARGLLTRPDILFLDEPTLGLDPQTRMRIWEYIKKVNDEGITIFLTTHYMDEADQLSDTILIIDQGKIIAEGTSESLKNALGKDMVYLETDDNDNTIEVLRNTKGILNVKRSSKGLIVVIDEEGSRFLPKIIDLLNRNGIGILSVSLKKPSLDDVFLHYTGRNIRDEQQGKESFSSKRKGGI